jgi:hypothetical protein
MSYFHEYFNRRDHKTLREYSLPFDLRRIDAAVWASGTKSAWGICEALDELRHFRLIERRQLKAVVRRDPFERRIGLFSQYRKPRALIERDERARSARQKRKRRT